MFARLGVSIVLAAVLVVTVGLAYLARLGDSRSSARLQAAIERSVELEQRELREFMQLWPMRGNFYESESAELLTVYGGEDLNNSIEHVIADETTGLTGQFEMHLCRPTDRDLVTGKRANYFTGFRLRLKDEHGNRWGIGTRLLGRPAPEDYLSFYPQDPQERISLSRFARLHADETKRDDFRRVVTNLLENAYLAEDEARGEAVDKLIRYIVLMFLRSDEFRTIEEQSHEADGPKQNAEQYFAKWKAERRWTYLLDAF